VKTVPNYALYGNAANPAWFDSFYVERIAERAGAYNWEIEPHCHDALIQILYVSGGSGEVLIDGAKWTFGPPCLIVVPAGTVHAWHFSDDIDGPVVTAAQRPLESLATIAMPELLRHIRSPAVMPMAATDRHVDALMPLFEAIERESRVHAPGQVAAGMSLLVALIVQIARIGAAQQKAPLVTRSRKSIQIERFRALIDSHFRDHLPVERYADELGVTSGQLTRLCREVLGMSSLDAIHARVVHEAQRDLVYSSLSVKQIAASLGFGDEAYFARFFKKQAGRTPTEFREIARRQLARDSVGRRKQVGIASTT
jgi:AraC family transcriptional activator of pobA